VNPVAELIQPEVCELIREGRYSELREALHGIPMADVADVMAVLTRQEAAIAFRFLPRDDSGQVFAYLSPEKQSELISELGDKGALRIVEGMDPDDRAKLLDELPPEVAQPLIASLSPEERKVTQAILGYPPRSVGRLMTPDYVRVKPEMTIGQALEHVRKTGRDAETINVVYVVDAQGVLIDDIRLRQLIFSDPTALVETLMNRSFHALKADQKQEEAVLMLQRYDRVALPVVDSRGVLLGIVTHDDIADVAQAEATEDIQKLGGMEALDEPYINTGPFQMFRKRGIWLALLFVGQSITIVVLSGFQDHLDKAVVLALFMPLVISCGGNSGSQAATLITRALALGEVGPKDWLKIMKKEIVSAAMLSTVLGVMGFVCVEFFTRVGQAKTTFPMLLGVTVALAVFLVVIWGIMLGSLLPLFLRRMRLDPASASSPMVATLMDASGTLIYFGMAVWLLSGTVL
jgi:magnesium transporter